MAARPVVQVVHSDITRQDVDAIVNAANSRLAGGGGVDGAIHRAAGEARLREACSALGGCPPGQVRVTPGFDLPARWIIHTVGPVWRGGESGEAETLASCYRSSLQKAEELGAATVAFPAISTGVYGFPPDLAAGIAVGTVREHRGSIDRILMVVFDDTTLAHYQELLEA